MTAQRTGWDLLRTAIIAALSLGPTLVPAICSALS